MEMVEMKKVPVVYYLCRNRQLEHPHFIEVALVSPDGLYLRDVLKKFESMRGKGMAAMYSWSCKRSYKNAFVWNDLCEDDLIVPAHGNEYVLKGSELFGDYNSGCIVPARSLLLQNVEQLTEPQSTITQDESSSTTSSSGVSPQSKSGKLVMLDSCHSLTKYKIYKSTNRLADASTQTEERVKEKGARKTCRRSFSIDSGTVESITNDSPPSSSGTCSSASKTDTLESLMKADGGKLNISESLVEEVKEDEEDKVPSNTKLSAANMLLQLFSCGSISAEDEYFGRPSSCSSRSLGSRFPSRLLSSSVRFGELDCLPERTSFMGIKLEDKQYFSGSLVETKSVKEEGISSLKRSSSYNANRNNKCDLALTRTKCIPRSIKASLSKHPRSASMRLSDAASSHILSPCSSNHGSKRMTVACSPKKPSKLTGCITDNKENMLKIDESRLASGARVIIHYEAPCDSKGL
ncbi:protein upstream of flc [Tanacetum coccineum]|uniref:Protein upstream of flc n=1 Tax=Tanacetum coccineum TaxID=301880 RepID=A0ABQ4ZGL4_9ASTR